MNYNEEQKLPLFIEFILHMAGGWLASLTLLWGPLLSVGLSSMAVMAVNLAVGALFSIVALWSGRSV